MTIAFEPTCLRDVIRIEYGAALKEVDRDKGGQYVVYGSSGPVGRHSEALVKHPTIIIGRKGSVGAITYAPNGGWPIDTAYYVQLLDEREIDLRYLYYFLANANLDANAITTSIPGLNRDTLYRTPIPLPPLAEQKRFAAILDKADAIRRKLANLAALSRVLPAAIFHDMFGDPGRNEGDWPTDDLGNLVRDDDTINYGVVQPGADVTEGIPIVRVGDFADMSIRVENLKRIEPAIEASYKRSRLVGDEVLIACVGSIGLIALADERLLGFNIVRAVARVRCGPRLNRVFLAWLLKTPHIQRFFTRETRTVSQPTLNIRQIEQTQIIVPPLQLQEQFARAAIKSTDTTNQLDAARARSDDLFNSLVQRAFLGEL